MASSASTPGLRDRFDGVLLGTAVGDALGLPGEGISRVRIQRMGMVSGGFVSCSAVAW